MHDCACMLGLLSVGQEEIRKASDTIVGGKRRRRPTREQEEAKTKQGELLKNQVDESDDDEPLLKKKNRVSTKTKETIITNKATEGTCLEKNVAYTYNDATYFGVVVKVEHTVKACTIRIVYATMICHSTNTTLNETQILNGKAETIVVTKTKASLLCKSNAVAGTNEERRHYLSDKTKYPKHFIQWLNRDTEEREGVDYE